MSLGNFPYYQRQTREGISPEYIAKVTTNSLSPHVVTDLTKSRAMIVVILALAAYVAAQTHYLYGPQWGWYSIRTTSAYLLSVETTLRPNAPPSPAQSRLALWPGMNTAKGLIQPIIVSSDERLFQGR
jgi:hypothetical protein